MKERTLERPFCQVSQKILASYAWLTDFCEGPYYFVTCSLLNDDNTRAQSENSVIKNSLSGTLVSSLHRLKDQQNKDGGFFVFGDVSVKVEGTYRLQFNLFEVRDGNADFLSSVMSDALKVFPSKSFPGMSESTMMTRTFSDQGVRLRLRKEPRFRLGARGPASDDYVPRHYNTQKRRQSQISSENSQGEQGSQAMQGLTQAADFGDPFRQPQDHTGMGSQESLQQSRPLLSSGGSYGSFGDGDSLKRVRSDTDQSQTGLWNQNYSTQAAQYPVRQPGYPQPTSQPVDLTMSMGQTSSSLYARDPSSLFNSRRASPYSPASPYDMSTGRQQVQSSSANYFAQQPPTAYSTIQPQQPYSQALSQPIAQGFQDPQQPQRMNSLDIPTYGAGFMPRTNYPGMAGMPPPTQYRQPSMSQGMGFATTSQLPPPSSGVEFQYGAWPPRDDVPRQ